jgi:frataxin-like iron-binding protein CyaY
MYALIHKNEIKVGPRDYHVAFFNKFFEDNSLAHQAPNYYDSRESIIFDDDSKIVWVNDAIIPSYNPITEQLAGPFWDSSSEPVSGYYEVADRSLDSAKNDLKASLANNRYNLEVSGVKVTIQGTELLIDTSRDNRNIWFQSLVLLPDNSTQEFKFSADQWLVLSKTDIQTIVNAIVSHVQSAFVWESSKIVEINSANDKLQLQNIDISIPASE